MSELDERIEQLQRELLQTEEEEERQRRLGNWWEYHGAVMRQNRLARELNEAQQEREQQTKGGTAG